MNQTMRQYRALKSDHVRREEAEQAQFEAWVFGVCIVVLLLIAVFR